MLFKLQLFPLILICMLQYPLKAQMAKYASISNGYDAVIPDPIGNNIHIWTASKVQSFFIQQDITLTLDVFSKDLQLLSKKRFHLPQVNRWNIDFRYVDNYYFAIIFFMSNDRSYSSIFKIDDSGNFESVPDSALPANQSVSAAQLNKNYTANYHDNNIFAIVLDNTVPAENEDLNKISVIGTENFNPEKSIQKIRISKTTIKDDGKSESANISAFHDFSYPLVKFNNNKNDERLEKVYGSSYLQFSYPRIEFKDSNIIASVFAKAMTAKNVNNPYQGNYLFLAKLDTNLNPCGNNTALIKIANAAKDDDYYAPIRLLSIKQKLFFISLGRSNYVTPRYYGPGFARPIGPNFPVIETYNLINSLRITLVDEKNNLLKDTIISSTNATRYEWHTRFIKASNDKIDFFCSIKYRASKFGIVHMSIDDNGEMLEDNIIVDEHYNYRLNAAKILNTGEMIVPYEKDGRVKGLMKLMLNRN